MNTQTARTNASHLAPPARGFTLIELLVVIAILAILIAIVLPVMGSARTAAKKADTRVLFSNLAQATAAFQIDQRRLPGYFSPRQMGAATNAARGFPTMDNMLLDLVGGVSPQSTGEITDATTMELLIGAVGPGNNLPGTPNADQVYLDYHAMGASKLGTSGAISRSYVQLDAKHYVRQGIEFNGTRYVNTDPLRRLQGSPNAHYFFPSLVDSFGTPILAWVADDVPSTGAFAGINVTTAAGTNGARYYQVQNAGFLEAQHLGKQLVNQQDTTAGSVLNSSAGTNILSTMEALLGNASQPDPASATPKPLGARAPIVFHSAGPDGVYVGRRDKGARAGFLSYTPNQDPFGGGLFDDIIGNAGN